MSVALFGVYELSTLAACLNEACKMPIEEAFDRAAEVAKANHETFCYAYQVAVGTEHYQEPVTREQIKEAYKQGLAYSQSFFGPIAYNLYSNGGARFGSDDLHSLLNLVGDKLTRHFDHVKLKQRKAEQQRQADELCPKLPKVNANVLLQRAAKHKKKPMLIVAEYMIDDSDSQMDYYGGSVARRIVIGICGSRIDFQQMRKAADQFPPTTHLGVGKDVWQAVAEIDSDIKQPTRYELLRDERYVAVTCSTREEIEAAVQGAIENNTDFGIYSKMGTVDYRCESIEHRENYSGGGGYYLGTNRYSGWRIRCESWGGDYEIEVHDPRLLDSSAETPASVATSPVIVTETHVGESVNEHDLEFAMAGDWTSWL